MSLVQPKREKGEKGGEGWGRADQEGGVATTMMIMLKA